MKKQKAISLIIIIILVTTIYSQGWHDFLTIDSLKGNQEYIQDLYQNYPLKVISAFIAVYVFVTSLSLPGATILTLAGGAIFGLFYGVAIVSIASTIGATLAMLGTRFLFREFVQNRFQEKFNVFNDGFNREGAYYLFSLRLVPVFPFFLINAFMGLTKIRVPTYFFVSQIGMLPATVVYVNAGTQLTQIDSLKGIVSFPVLLSFALLGILPFFAKWLLRTRAKRKQLAHFKRPSKFDYNVVVIGGGSAGLVASYIAAAVKAKVALVEKHKMGGDCLNTGCVPSKAFIRSAKVASFVQNSEHFGIRINDVQVSFKEVMNRVRTVITKVEPHDSVDRYTALGVDCILENAKILSPFEVKVGERILTCKNIIIATGASPAIPKLQGLEAINYLTSDNLWTLNELPKKLLVLGGGAIGCELAQSFQRLGSEVVLIEKSSRLMVREDEDVSQEIERKFLNEGIVVIKNAEAVNFRGAGESGELIFRQNNELKSVNFDRVILALGRKANVKGFGLEELGVRLNENGTISHDEFLRTNFDNIFVCGDVAGPYQLTHVAAHQAWYASVNALFSPIKKMKVNYSVIPWCTFTDPEVARVGASELELKSKNIQYEVTQFQLNDLDRAIADSTAEGFIKVVTKKGSDKILGVTIVGSHAGEMIAEYILAMRHNIGLNKILGTIHIYPTYSEANKYVAGVWRRAHAPQKILSWLEKFHQLRRRDN